MRFDARTLGLATIMVGVACSHSEDAADLPAHDSGLPSLDAGFDTDARIDGAATPEARRVCTVDAWCNTPVPAGQTLVDVWADGEGSAWVVSSEGAILQWDGTRWQTRLQEKGDFRAIWGTGPGDLWIGGARGLLHGDGSSFTPVDLGEEGISIDDIAGGVGGEIWAVGRVAASAPPSPEPGPGPKPTPETSHPRAYRLASGAAGWVRDPLDGVTAHAAYASLTEIRRVWSTASGDVWIVAAKGESGGGPMADGMDYLFRRPAGAPLGWAVAPMPTEVAGESSFQFSGAGAVGGDAWLMGGVGHHGAVYWKTENGAPVVDEDWQLGTWGMAGIFGHAVWGMSGSDVWVMGTSGQIRHWNGSTWTSSRVSVDGDPIRADLVAVWGRSNDDIWTVGGDRALHKVSVAEAERSNEEARDQ